MTELNDFIAEALVSIVCGIQKGQTDPSVGDHIAPLIQGEERNRFGNFHLKDDATNQATIVQFDVQVATERQSGATGSGKAKFRLYVVDAEIKAGGNTGSNVSNVHRLQFAIPIKIPRRPPTNSE